MESEKMRVLFENVSKHLANRRVLLRFREPPTAFGAGECYRPEEAPSLVLIDICPGLSLSEKFKTMLHETAHAALGHVDRVPATTRREERSGHFVKTSSYWQNDHKADPREVEAIRLADRWAAWAEVEAKKYIEPGDPEGLQIVIKLVNLKYYKD